MVAQGEVTLSLSVGCYLHCAFEWSHKASIYFQKLHHIERAHSLLLSAMGEIAHGVLDRS